MQSSRSVVKPFLVVAGLLIGCASRPPHATCGAGWEPLTLDKAPPAHVAVDRTDSMIERVEIAGVDDRLAEILRRELATKPGMTIATAPIGDDIRRLWKLGVVAEIAVERRGETLIYVLTPRPTIHSITSVGGDALAQARFRRLAATSFEPARVRRMTDALRESYVRDGRLDASVEAKHRTGPAGVDVCVALDPGPRITIAKLAFPGRKGLPEKALVSAMRSKKINHPGGMFDEDAFELDLLYMQSAYWDAGYAGVHFHEPTLARRGKHLVITLPIDEGPVYHLGSIKLPYPIDVKLPIKHGDRFSRTNVANARTAIEEALHAYTVLPLTQVDPEARRIDLSFEIEWRYPWDASRYWLSHLH